MGCGRLQVDHDIISVITSTLINTHGGINGQAVDPTELNPYRKQVEHDITILKALLKG